MRNGRVTIVADTTLNKITHILRAEGCTEIILFGSQATGAARPHSDIDIGVKGLPPAHFLATYARLDREIQEKIDFIDFDEQTAFFQFLNDIGEIKKNWIVTWNRSSGLLSPSWKGTKKKNL